MQKENQYVRSCKISRLQLHERAVKLKVFVDIAASMNSTFEPLKVMCTDFKICRPFWHSLKTFWFSTNTWNTKKTKMKKKKTSYFYSAVIISDHGWTKKKLLWSIESMWIGYTCCVDIHLRFPFQLEILKIAMRRQARYFTISFLHSPFPQKKSTIIKEKPCLAILCFPTLYAWVAFAHPCSCMPAASSYCMTTSSRSKSKILRTLLNWGSWHCFPLNFLASISIGRKEESLPLRLTQEND